MKHSEITNEERLEKARRTRRKPAPDQNPLPSKAEGEEAILHANSSRDPQQPPVPFQGVQRLEIAARGGQYWGNRGVQRLINPEASAASARGGEVSASVVQRDGKVKLKPANPGGRGPGRIKNAAEQPYDVSGATLADAAPQLTQLGGFAAESSTPLGIQGRVAPQRLQDGTFQARVQWTINGAAVKLPRWTGYDHACPAAQQEWDRFMGKSRQHEQEAHVDAARSFVAGLNETDSVITGATVADLQANLTAKQQELGARLQAIHDTCDHGAAIDAILHPDQGTCEEET
jgi:predicted secreted Zn-dependent protease